MLSEHTRTRLKISFAYQDWNNDGKIDINDYHIALQKHADVLGFEEGSRRYNNLWTEIETMWNNLRKHADLDHDGIVTWEEFLAFNEDAFSQGDSAVVGIAQLIFEGIDTDRDGKISSIEWAVYLNMLGMDGSQADSIFAKLDTNKDGLLQIDELQTALKTWYLSEDPCQPGHWLFGDPTKLKGAK